MIYISAYRSTRRSILPSCPVRANRPLVTKVRGGLLVTCVAFPVPGLREILQLVPLQLADWILAMAVAVALSLVVEIGKAISNHRHRLVAVRDTTLT